MCGCAVFWECMGCGAKAASYDKTFVLKPNTIWVNHSYVQKLAHKPSGFGHSLHPYVGLICIELREFARARVFVFVCLWEVTGIIVYKVECPTLLSESCDVSVM